MSSQEAENPQPLDQSDADVTPPFPTVGGGGLGDGQSGSAAASLETQLDQEKDARREERFVWIVVCVILIDVIWLRSAHNVTMAVAVVVLELVILFIIAKRLGIEEIPEFLSRTADKLSGSGTA